MRAFDSDRRRDVPRDHALSRHRRRMRNVALILVACAALAIVLSRAWRVREEPDAAPVVLSRALINEAFFERLAEDLADRWSVALGLHAWEFGPDSSLILRLTGPAAGQPPPLWELLSPRERTLLMEQIAVAYTRAIVVSGHMADLRAGHPVITLAYDGSPQPLATRERSGAVRIYSSPYDTAPPPPVLDRARQSIP